MVTHSGASGRIAVDAMGGDLGPAEVVAAVKLALHQESLNPITLVGDEAVLRSALSHAGLRAGERITIVHASEVITMDDKPTRAFKAKKDSSMVRALELVKSGESRVAVTSPCISPTENLPTGGTPSSASAWAKPMT